MRHWFQALRPLFWWALFVAALYAYRLHQRLIEQTRLTFSVTLEDRPVDYETSATLDGKPIGSSNRVPLGWHKFLLSHPKADLVSTNLFIWYGEHNLGQFSLTRQQGTLGILVSPPAAVLVVRGAEFSQTLTNSRGLTVSVPTGRYSVEAQYLHLRETCEAEVTKNTPGTCQMFPLLGVLAVASSKEDATFQLLDPNDRRIEEGRLPVVIKELPVGNYKLIGVHHDYRRQEDVSVRPGVTNSIRVEFSYGAALLETEPAGAEVLASNGRSLGVTPLNLSELRTGRWDFSFQRDGYEPVSTSLEIAADKTSTFRTNLVNSSYVRAISSARQYLQNADYARASAAAGEALSIQKNDADAVAIQKAATCGSFLQRAEAYGKKGEYAAGIKELESGLLITPESAEMKRLLTDLKQREDARLEQMRREEAIRAERIRQEAEQRAERLRQEQSSAARKVFDSLQIDNRDAELFESHQITTGKPVADAAAAIAAVLQRAQPAFVVTAMKSSEADTFALEAKQEVPGGFRRCVIVGGQTWPKETQILFKVFEYTSSQPMKTLGGLVSLKSNLIFAPVHPAKIDQMTDALRMQVRDGVSAVTERLQQAIR